MATRFGQGSGTLRSLSRAYIFEIAVASYRFQRSIAMYFRHHQPMKLRFKQTPYLLNL